MNNYYDFQLARERHEETAKLAEAKLSYERDESGAAPVRVDLRDKLTGWKASLQQMMTPVHSRNKIIRQGH